jgi:hypothetical protein
MKKEIRKKINKGFFLNEKNHKVYLGTKKPSYPWNKNIIVLEIWEMEEENERKNKKKKVCWLCERERKNKIGEGVDEWILLIRIGE